jgi:[ribosomal protein S5]-alanine N-acetyltransferase
MRVETRRLILRPLEPEDIPRLVPALDNFNVSKWTARIPRPYTAADAEDYLEWLKTLRAGSASFTIDLKGGAKTIGGIGYQMIEGDAAPELGYWLAEAFWRRGYGSEAAEAVADHAFAVSGHRRLLAGYQIGNEASRKILERLGFRATGEATKPSLAQGRDVPVMGMILER